MGIKKAPGISAEGANWALIYKGLSSLARKLFQHEFDEKRHVVEVDVAIAIHVRTNILRLDSSNLSSVE